MSDLRSLALIHFRVSCFGVREDYSGYALLLQALFSLICIFLIFPIVQMRRHTACLLYLDLKLMMVAIMNRGSISFSLFGIPIEIQPFAWLLLAFLGGAFRINDAGDISPVLIFMVAGMISVIAHELGHALVGRKLMGGSPYIQIGGMGGVTINEHMRHATRWNFFAMVFGGPLAGFIPAVLAFVLLVLQTGSLSASLAFVECSTFPFFASEADFITARTVIESFYNFDTQSLSMMYHVYTSFFLVGIWWTILNLLPIFPLDGGKLLGTLLNNFKVASMVGIVFSALFLLFGLYSESVYNCIIAAYIAYLNWQHFQQFRIISR